ncbi:MAG: MFS transporter, partial [Proteobacteria bacterium]|nr:MFS transporter [Pseudomonadota bacterium]
GGLLLIIGIPVAYAVAVGLSVIAVTMLLPLRLNTQIYSKEPITIPNLLAGLRFVFTRKVVLGLVSLDFFVVLVGGVRALLPIFATDILQTDQAGFGILKSAETVGSLACFLLLTHLPIRRRAGDKMLITVVLYGCGIIVFGLSTNFALSYAALFFMGATDAISMFIRQNVVLLVSPDDLRGRINAVNSVFTSSSGQIGEFESGVTAAIFNTVPAVIIGGVGSIVIALSYAKLFPALRSIDSLDPDDLVRRFGDQDVLPDATLQTDK